MFVTLSLRLPLLAARSEGDGDGCFVLYRHVGKEEGRRPEVSAVVLRTIFPPSGRARRISRGQPICLSVLHTYITERISVYNESCVIYTHKRTYEGELLRILDLDPLSDPYIYTSYIYMHSYSWNIGTTVRYCDHAPSDRVGRQR